MNLQSDNLQGMPVNTITEGVMRFWEQLIKPRMERISIYMTEEELSAIVDEMWAGCKDLPVDKVAFEWMRYTIDGNDRKPCVEGTILDVKSATSDIYQIYKKFSTAVRCLKSKNTLTPHCINYCEGCVKFSKENCIATIKSLIPITFGESGAFKSIRDKISAGNWKL